ncbi:MAG: glycoside hydrolase family 127 protein [Bacteroidaceae bacterium]|nr:glycoside hydrolase family 127 protein [Bacteroidaceae bacterium]
MKKTFKRSITAFAVLTFIVTASAKEKAPGYPIDGVPFTQVKVTADSFWGDRIRQSREVTIPLAFSKCEETDRYTNFEHAAAKMAETARGDNSSNYRPTQFPFDDTDVYKTIEGASYLLQTYPDKKLEAYIDSVLDIVAAAQEPDGYLYTARTMNPAHPHDWSGPTRWSAEESGSHELYNLGHMVESAIAHYQATGSRKFLDIAIRYADCVCREIGYGPGQKVVVPGHQIAEMALAKLYLVTGEKKYLDEAKLFLDNKGKTARKDKYDQSYKPVIEQDEAVGHSVRAGYMYSGMADVAALTGDQSYVTAIDRIWDNMVGKKMYLTGGIGSTGGSEGFTENYDLPNMTGYCETCAAIANVYTNYRLFLLHGDAKYMDVLERALYNGVISGVSLDGGGFFYPNPLESHGQHQRQAWFGCACCPSNICRFIPSVPGYAYATKDNRVFVNLYLSNTLSTKVNGQNLQLTQSTSYPWEGRIEFTVEKAPSRQFSLNLRIPGWARNEPVPTDLYRYADGKNPVFNVYLNGEKQEITANAEGYAVIDRKWKKGDKVVLDLPMETRLVEANSQVREDRGKIAVERGPIVYCAEWPDNDFNILSTTLSDRAAFTVVPTGMTVEGKQYSMNALETTAQENYTGNPAHTRSVKLRLIPYYAWAHRGNGNMEVWINRQSSQSRQPRQSR